MSASEDLARLALLAAEHRREIEAAGSEEAVADWIYSNWYIGSGAGEEDEPDLPFEQVAGALTALAARALPWESDWIVLSAGPDGSIVAGRGTATRWQQAGTYASAARFGLPPVPGELVSLSPALAWTDPTTGQWAARSPDPPVDPLVRIYTNVGAGTVGLAVAALLELLAGEGVPFSMKCPGHVSGFARADALVLYLEAGSWRALEKRLVERILMSGAVLRAGHPALSKRLRNGIAFAEDPGGGQSFGKSRCLVLAPAVMRAAGDGAALVEALGEALQAAGIDAHHPWKSA